MALTQVVHDLTDNVTPTGVVLPFAGSSAPTGWLLCYGQAVSRTTYANLYAVISTTYGTGDGSTTFNVPDLRGRIPGGKDNMGGSAASRLTTGGGAVDGATLGAVGGAETHTLTTAQMPSHTHGVTLSKRSDISGSGARQVAVDPGDTPTGTISATSASAGSGSAHPNVQPTIVLNYIVKT